MARLTKYEDQIRDAFCRGLTGTKKKRTNAVFATIVCSLYSFALKPWLVYNNETANNNRRDNGVGFAPP